MYGGTSARRRIPTAQRPPPAPPEGTDVPSSVRSCVAGLALAILLAAGAASGQELVPQPPKQRGGFFVPMLSVAETLDDNLFFTQFPESDFVTRVGLAVETGYRSTPFTIDVQALRAADFFQQHSDFNTTRAKTVAQASLTYLPVRPLTVSVFACYFDTRTPSELNLISGLALGRSLATRISAAPMMEYRFSTRWTVTGAYPVAHDTLDGRVSDTQTAILGFDRGITRRDTLSLRYERRFFEFSVSGGETLENSTADVVTLGWTGQVGERTFLLLRAGPRFGKGEVRAEVLAALKRRVKRGLVSVTYSKTQATTLGKTGALDTQSLVATFSLRVARNLEIASAPGVYRNSLRGQELSAVRLNLETLWHFSPWFHLGASYTLDLQQPDFGVPGRIRRGGFQVRIIASPQQQRPEPPTADAPPQQEAN